MGQTDNIFDALSIYNICRQGATTLGPGLRYVIWTQGCMQNCQGCLTPESRIIKNNKQVLVEDLAKDVISREYIDGITISGGEPFLQSALLTRFLDLVLKKRPELTIIVFTGYQIENLSGEDAKSFINKLDLLIDGPYVESLNDNKGLRGSSNQRFHYITSRLLPWKDEMENGKRKVEYHVYNDIVRAYGIPSNTMILR